MKKITFLKLTLCAVLILGATFRGFELNAQTLKLNKSIYTKALDSYEKSSLSNHFAKKTKLTSAQVDRIVKEQIAFASLTPASQRSYIEQAMDMLVAEKIMKKNEAEHISAMLDSYIEKDAKGVFKSVKNILALSQKSIITKEFAKNFNTFCEEVYGVTAYEISEYQYEMINYTTPEYMFPYTDPYSEFMDFMNDPMISGAGLDMFANMDFMEPHPYSQTALNATGGSGSGGESSSNSDDDKLVDEEKAEKVGMYVGGAIGGAVGAYTGAVVGAIATSGSGPGVILGAGGGAVSGAGTGAAIGGAIGAGIGYVGASALNYFGGSVMDPCMNGPIEDCLPMIYGPGLN